MSYAVVVTKVDPKIKKEAMDTAEKLGMPLSVVIKAFLKQFIRTETINFSTRVEVPNNYLKQVLHQAKKDLEAGKASPVFENAKDAIAWLHRD